MIGLLARLLGFRVVERTDDHIILRVPGWIPTEGKQRAVEHVLADAALTGKHPQIAIGHRLIRVDL